MKEDTPPEGTPQEAEPERPESDLPATVAAPSTAASTGRRQAFRDVRRQIEEADLGNPAIQKMLLDDLERAEAECEILHGYVERYHDADKRAAVLDERLRTKKSLEIFFGVGVGMGGTIMGLAPFFWDKQPQGALVLLVGILLVMGATVGRTVAR